MKTAGLIAVIIAVAVFLPSCSKEAKSLKEELRVVKEENSFLKAENIALKKEVEELYRKLEEKDKAKAAVPQAQPVPAKTDTPRKVDPAKKEIKPPVSGKPSEKPAEKVKKPESEKVKKPESEKPR